MKPLNYKRLIISLVLPQLAGLIGSVFTISAIPAWYASLEKPSFSPPNWIFGPVWITLYFLMGLSVYLVWQKIKENKKAKAGLALFWLQLFFNAVWSIIFFGLQSPGWAFVEIIFLWLAIVLTIIAFSKVSRLAALLLIPYILWVTFAAYLNYSIWTLNIAT